MIIKPVVSFLRYKYAVKRL